MKQRFSYLALGDSYTIGECVEQSMSFPYQLKASLTDRELDLHEPIIVAKTGWTTDELLSAIKHAELNEQYDLVTLLIGVNNQYRGYSIDVYKTEFRSLLEKAISFSRKGKSNVVVISIPDWGQSPYGLKSEKDLSVISAEIEFYNTLNREITYAAGVEYIDITPISKRGLEEPALLASDGLHPSGEMYKEWVELLSPVIEKFLK